MQNQTHDSLLTGKHAGHCAVMAQREWVCVCVWLRECDLYKWFAKKNDILNRARNETNIIIHSHSYLELT